MAGCQGCGIKPWDPNSRYVGSSMPDQPNNGYTLRAFPDCEDRWQGIVESVYLVGRGTEDEKLFSRVQFADAAQYAKTNGHLFMAQTSQFCAEAIEALLAGGE